MSTDVLAHRPPAERAFGRFALGVLVYLLAVILFGAWVRVTGSGAGCGEHWPTCHGDIVPRSPSQETLIEFGHRFTSGLLGLMCLALPVWAFRRFPRGHAARWASAATLALVMVEAAIGARLVLSGLVASNASVARAVAVALHLVNTLLLTASAAVTVAAARGPAPAPRAGDRASPADVALSLVLLLSLVLVAATGAVTALGDTLFPVRALGGGAPPSGHFLVQLRVVHPVLACAVVLLALEVARRFSAAPPTRPWARAVAAFAIAQLLVGGVSIVLGAPGWLQLVHLLGAQLSWISSVMLVWTSIASARAHTRPGFGPSALPWSS